MLHITPELSTAASLSKQAPAEHNMKTEAEHRTIQTVLS